MPQCEHMHMDTHTHTPVYSILTAFIRSLLLPSPCRALITSRHRVVLKISELTRLQEEDLVVDLRLFRSRRQFEVSFHLH